MQGAAVELPTNTPAVAEESELDTGPMNVKAVESDRGDEGDCQMLEAQEAIEVLNVAASERDKVEAPELKIQHANDLHLLQNSRANNNDNDDINNRPTEFIVFANAAPEPPSTKNLEVAVSHTRHSSSTGAGDYPTPNSDTGASESVHGTAQPLSEGGKASGARPPILERQQSILPKQQSQFIKTLLETDLPPLNRADHLDFFKQNGPSTISAKMVNRKIWVKRPQASATLVQINEDDLVDDVRDMILKRYANSLGRNFDAPDVTLRIAPRDQRQERQLGPEEPMSRTIDACFPGGQTVEEALIIDVPLKRTPKPSPRGQPIYTYTDDLRPVEAGTEYFPPMPIHSQPSPRLPVALPVNGVHHPALTQHAMSVLTTGHVPNLPSPGSARNRYQRPRTVRQHTSSPTVLNGSQAGTHSHLVRSRSRTHSNASEKSVAAPAPPPLPTPPAQAADIQRISTPPPRVSSPRPGKSKRSKRNNEQLNLPAGLLNGSVPPINVLIVEDNIINLRLLEAFMKRLKVRWQTAMNGKEAVTKWRAGGFHLVLMDIQLPVMNGLEATREIRRLEKLNSIGVFSSSASSKAPEMKEEPEGEDRLPSSVLFKSPVIIVALTASSLQSDRHEALAAGCNDFLTKVCHYSAL